MCDHPAPLVRSPRSLQQLRCTVAAWIGSPNLGDELVFAALSAQLAERGVTVDALSVAPAATAADHGVSARRRLQVLRPGAGGDATILGGGGLLQDETSTLNLDLHLTPVAAARVRRTPVAGVGLGAGPLHTRYGRRLVRSVLAGAPVAVRDDASADLLQAIGLPRPTVAADLVLSLPDVGTAPTDRVVACLRPWSGRRHRLPARLRRHRPDERFVAGAARGLDDLADDTGMPVHLVAFDASKDGPLHDAVAARMRTPVTLSAPDRHRVLAEVAASRLVVAMRYHGGLAAVVAGRPTVLVGYSPKVDALATELGSGTAATRWSPDGLTGLPEAARKVIDRGDDVVAARDRLRQRERRNGAILDQLLERATAEREETTLR